MRLRSILRLTYRTNAAVADTQPMKVHEAETHLCELSQVQSVYYPHQTMSTYKNQTIGTRVRLGVLGNVPIWHPRTHDADRKQFLRNLDDPEHVRVRVELALFDYTAVYLVSSELSTLPVE